MRTNRKRIVVMSIFPLIMFFGILGYIGYEFIMNHTAEEIVVKATVISKDKDVSSYDSFDTDKNHRSVDTSYIVTFDTEDKGRMTFDVNRKMYNKLLVGDKGTAYYQRKKLNKFELDY